MKHNYYYFFTIITIVLLIIISCQDKEGIIYNGVSDVSSRITGMTEEAGVGDTIFVSGTGFENIQRIIIGDQVIAHVDIEFTVTGIKFLVPIFISNGETDVIFIFSGNEKAFKSITIIARQTISWFDPSFANAGDTVTVYGTNLYVATNVKIGSAEGVILEQPGNYLTFIVPAGAVTDVIYIFADEDYISSSNELICCESSEENICLPNLILNGDGGFELGTIGVAASDADIGPGWVASGIGGATPVQWVEVIPVSELPEPNYPNLGSLAVKVTLSSDYIHNSLTNTWQMQLVNTVDPVNTGRRFLMMGKVWSDMAGRQIKLTGGVARPGFENMDGVVEITLERGWNEFTNEITHTPTQEDDHVRIQLNYGYALNEGVTFYFDDIRLVDIGPRE